MNEPPNSANTIVLCTFLSWFGLEPEGPLDFEGENVELLQLQGGRSMRLGPFLS